MDKSRTKRERRLTVNNSNLIPNTERSPEELREMGRKGGIASGKARRRKRDLQKLAKMLLDKQTAESFKEILGIKDNKVLSGKLDAAFFVRLKQALQST